MEKPSSQPRFRINPLELGIFTLVVLVFLNAAYNLLDEGADMRLTALAPAHEVPSVQTRSPASLKVKGSPSLETKSIDCSAETVYTVHAPRVRLTGKLCPADPASGEFQTAMVRRLAGGGRQPRIFVDPENGTFSTDYISLEVGTSELELEFTYAQTAGRTGNRVESKRIKVVRQGG